jgi:uncharacterized protein (TIGR00369 family)
MAEAGETAAGVVPLATLKSLSGLDFLRGIAEGRLPGAPIAALLGFRLSVVEPGRAVFTATPALRHYNPIGTVHGGFAATLLDSCMSCAVQTTLAAGLGYTTVEFKVNLVRAITAETGPVTAVGELIHAGRQVATAEGRLQDGSGRLLAHGLATCLILPL